PDQHLQRCRVARGDDQAVRAFVQGLFEERHVTFAEPRIAAEVDVQRRFEHRGRLADAFAKRVPEERELAREVDGDLQRLARLEVAGGEVGPITERFGGPQDTGARHRVDTRLCMECAVYGARRDSERAGDVLDAHGCRRRVHPLSPSVCPAYFTREARRAILSLLPVLVPGHLRRTRDHRQTSILATDPGGRRCDGGGGDGGRRKRRSRGAGASGGRGRGGSRRDPCVDPRAQADDGWYRAHYRRGAAGARGEGATADEGAADRGAAV